MVKLKECGVILTGNTPKTSELKNYCSRDIPFVKPSDIEDNNLNYIESAEFYISEFARSNARIIPKNSVLVTCIGIIGKVAINSIECAFNQQINAIVPDVSICLAEYIAYALCYKKNILQSVANAPVVPILNKTQFSEIEIELPALSEQVQIVKKLSALDIIINERKQQLQKLDELVKSRFVEMFGDPFDTTKWAVKKLKDISESMIDGSNVNPDFYKLQGDVLFLRIQNVWRNEFRLDDSVYITQEINHKYYYDTSLKTGDLLITKIGRYYTKDSSLGRVSVYRGENDCANYSNNIMRVRLNDSVNSEFVNVLLNLDDYQSYIKRTSKGGTDKRALSKSLIGSYPIIIPPKTLQEKFVSFVKQVDKSKFEVQQSLEKLETLKKALMQKYFG